MARAQVLRQVRVLRQRQEAPGLGEAVALDQHRAVVNRGGRQEDREEQLARNAGIEADAAVDVGLEVGLALQGDQGADALGGERLRAAHALLQQAILLDRVQKTQQRRLAHVRQGPAQLGLKEDDDDQHDRAEEVLQHPVHRVEPDPAGGEGDGQQHPQPDEHLDGARAAQQHDEVVKDDGHDQDVQPVLPPQGWKRLGEQVHAAAPPSIASAIRSARRTALTS